MLRLDSLFEHIRESSLKRNWSIPRTFINLIQSTASKKHKLKFLLTESNIDFSYLNLYLLYLNPLFFKQFFFSNQIIPYLTFLSWRWINAMIATRFSVANCYRKLLLTRMEINYWFRFYFMPRVIRGVLDPIFHFLINLWLNLIM